MLTLIGAGPGDPELITVKGLKALQEADVVFYDSLINPLIFKLAFGGSNKDQARRLRYRSNQVDYVWEDLNWGDLAPDDFFSYKDLYNEPELIFVGKRRAEASASQESINEMILNRLQRGQNIVRLKGGDPFVFGRGVEEVEYVNKHGFEARIIPGLTSGIAVPVSAGIALTMRGKSDSIILVTGHKLSQSKISSWIKFLESGSTLVIYMGFFNLPDLVHSLKSVLPLNFPAVIIQNGTLANEKIIKSSLENILVDIEACSEQAPTILIFGEHIDQGLKLSAEQSILHETAESKLLEATLRLDA
jgi:uroporphyrin-III C-methyltransferase